jgi:hypothetical protein
MGILEDLETSRRARECLKAIADGKDVRLTAEQAKSILSHMRWLGEERESLLRSLPYDD